jgi:hypothetical protein
MICLFTFLEFVYQRVLNKLTLDIYGFLPQISMKKSANITLVATLTHYYIDCCSHSFKLVIM